MEVVTSSSVLKERIETIRNSAEFVCLDTEFVREKTYYPTLGLVQVAANIEGGETVFAIDPIDNNIDLTPLKDLMQDEKVIKVFHACGQDLEIFYNLFDATPKNLFDTQVGAKMLGFGESISYGRLAEDYLKKRLDKSHRYTDWTRRPLEPEQIEYAAYDVIYLKDIFILMRKELLKKDRYSWACEESTKLLDEGIYKVDVEEVWKKLKVRSNDRQYLAVIKSLARWREVTAQNQNRPRPWILKDDAILEIAAVKPKKPEDLRGLRFFKYDERLVNDILGVVDFGLNEEKPPKIEASKKMPESALAILALLKIILKSQSYKHNIAPSVIADNDDLDMLALGNYKGTRSMQGWRYEVFGKFAEKLRDGKLAITANKGDIILIEPSYE
jgi:ribonuclease D